jgi:glutaredoxin
VDIDGAVVRLVIAGVAIGVVIVVAAWGRASERRRSATSDLNLAGIEGSVLFFTDAACLRCAVVRDRLDELGVEYSEIAFNHEPELQASIGVQGVPQVVVRAGDGSIAARLVGSVSRRQLSRAVRKTP